MPYRILILAVCFPFVLCAQTGEKPLTLKEASYRMLQKNPTLQIADRAVDMARSSQRKLNAAWLPTVNATGTYLHLKNDIGVELDALSLFIPLIDNNLTSVGINAAYPIFTGGKRIFASSIGKRMVNLAQMSKEETRATLQTDLVQRYYALRLSSKVVEVRKEAYVSLQKHYRNALSMEVNGMINKAERLFAQVSMEEARREWESAEKECKVAREALYSLLRIENDSLIIVPVSPLFICHDLPDESYFNHLIENSYTLGKLRIEERMADNEWKIAKSAYLPEIAVFGTQTVYARHLPENLMPRTIIGVAFTWNLFDGFNREADVRLAKLNRQSLVWEKEAAKDGLSVLVSKLYSELKDAQDEVTTLHATIEMNEELLRIRRKSFTEGMATSTEVVDAEVMLSKVQVAMLMAYYQFDVALASLCSTCGVPELFWTLMDRKE